MARRQKLDPHTSEPRDPLELLARLLVGSSYRVPAQGRGHGGMMNADVAGAIGLMRDRTAKAVIVAVATRGGKRGAVKITKSAWRHVLRAVLQSRPPILDLRGDKVRWANRFRLRIACYNAALELIHPECIRPWAELAKEARMRRTAYINLHKLCSAVLQEQMNNGRREFTLRLYSHGSLIKDMIGDES